jgi:hypothetical protein
MSNARAPSRADPQTAHVDWLESDSEMSVAVTTSVSGTSPQRKLCLTAAPEQVVGHPRRAFVTRAASLRSHQCFDIDRCWDQIARYRRDGHTAFPGTAL